MPLDRTTTELASRVWPVLDGEPGSIRSLDTWLRENNHPLATSFRNLIQVLGADTYGGISRGRVTVDTRIEGPVNPDALKQFLGDIKRLFWGELFTFDSTLATLERPILRPATILSTNPDISTRRKVG